MSPYTNILKSEFAKKGISQKELAIKLGIYPNYFYRKVNMSKNRHGNVNVFTLEEAIKICEYLDISLDIFKNHDKKI